MTKTIAILGATGSVGAQAQSVARERGYTVDFLTAKSDVLGLEAAVREFRPKYVAMRDGIAARDLSLRIKDTDTRVLSGDDGICEGIALSSADVVVNSILGKAGLAPTLATIDAKKRLALANKESLVIAGEIVMKRRGEKDVEIIPVDSEHSAIFQSLKAGKREEIKRIILTASGGPFFGKTKEELKRVTLSDTLRHPTWKMGKKITVDSATLMNKGFEIIEAVHLFGISSEKIEVVIHRESILHSAVEYIDNTLIGEFSYPDMRAPLQYAIDYPERTQTSVKPLDLFSFGSLSFAKPDTEAFPALTLARRAISMGGAMPAVLNAADEVAVAAFLSESISFTDIYNTVSHTLESMSEASGYKSLEEILSADRVARDIATEYIEKNKR